MKENAQTLLRMLTEFHRQVQDSLGERGKPPLLLGDPVVRTFNVYLDQMKEMFPDSFIAQLSPVESVPEPGETELASDELEKLHLAKSHEVSMACSQIIEYLTGILNGEVGLSKTMRGLPEILAVLDTLRQDIQELQLTDSEEDKRITQVLVGKYNDCLSVCHETVGESDAILPRLFKPIEFAGEVPSGAILEVKISASGLHAYLEAVEQQEATLKKQQRTSTLELTRIEDRMNTQEKRICGELEDVRQQAEETKEQVFQKIDERVENVEVQFEERVQQLEERLDEMNENADELKDQFNETMDERYDEMNEKVAEVRDGLTEGLDERVGNLEEKLDERIGELDERTERIGELEERLEEARQKNEELDERTERVGELEERLEETRRNIEEFEERLNRSEEEYSERVDGLNERLEEINQRLDEKEERMGERIDEKVRHLEEQRDERIGELDERFDELNQRLDELAETLDEKVNQLSEERDEHASGLNNRMEELREEIEQRIEELKEQINE